MTSIRTHLVAPGGVVGVGGHDVQRQAPRQPLVVLPILLHLQRGSKLLRLPIHQAKISVSGSWHQVLQLGLCCSQQSQARLLQRDSVYVGSQAEPVVD
jgi:hypothetical protein